ncbi:MAG: hypothetical protein AAB458_01505 [Patescibacteria group bacterium]
MTQDDRQFMTEQFALIQEQFISFRSEMDGKFTFLETKLSEKIESEIENLATLTMGGFHEMDERFTTLEERLDSRIDRLADDVRLLKTHVGIA